MRQLGRPGDSGYGPLYEACAGADDEVFFGAAPVAFLGGIVNGWYGMVVELMSSRMRCRKLYLEAVVDVGDGWAQDGSDQLSRTVRGIPSFYVRICQK